MRRALVAVVALATLAFIPSLAHAEAKRRPVGVGGYFRVMARPDFQGGVGRLGFSPTPAPTTHGRRHVSVSKEEP